jgi:DNA-3-methyladenine glycosylase
MMATVDLARPVWQAAPEMLGWYLCRRLGDTVLRGKIVETEAYAAAEDAASHAFRGPTPRNRSMFGECGRAYVYFIYGTHFCLNVVAHPPGEAGAVLIRALEPLAGLEIMQQFRGNKPVTQLCSGPGKLCQAMQVDRSLDGCNMLQPDVLWLEPAATNASVAQGPRIGIRLAAELPWRFWLEGNPHVSRRC